MNTSETKPIEKSF